MKSASEILLEKSVADVFKNHRWLKQGRTWRREGEFITSFYNLQKSNWGDDLFYENVGFSLCALSQGRYSNDLAKWDGYARVRNIVPSGGISGCEVNFDRGNDPQVEVDNCVNVILIYVIPYFNDLDSIESLRRFYNGPEGPKFHLSRSARDWMEGLGTNRSV